MIVDMEFDESREYGRFSQGSPSLRWTSRPKISWFSFSISGTRCGFSGHIFADEYIERPSIPPGISYHFFAVFRSTSTSSEAIVETSHPHSCKSNLRKECSKELAHYTQ